MFLHICVCPQGGVGIPGCAEADPPPGADSPQEQTPPRSRHPPRSRPPKSRHPSEADPPRSKHPREETPPLGKTATAGDGTHPTGMHSYSLLYTKVCIETTLVIDNYCSGFYFCSTMYSWCVSNSDFIEL